MDNQRFTDACDYILKNGTSDSGIGTLSEKTLHAVLKRYYEPCDEDREVKIGRFVADIVGENGIIEIQTQSFERLKAKLEAFLSCTDVTVVYPIAKVKYICRIDPVTGEASKPRKSPVTGTVYHAFKELYHIRELLISPRLHIKLVLLEITEYRTHNNKSRRGRRGDARCERIPTKLFEEVSIDCRDDWNKLIPEGLNDEFTAKEFAALCKLDSFATSGALKVLSAVGLVEKGEKQGRAYIYKRIDS